jgi:hypothetical protein
MRALFLVLALAGCAVGKIQRADGTMLTGIAIGNAEVECCEKVAETGDKRCDKVAGGPLSTGVAETLYQLGSALMAMFATGAL